MKGYQACDGSYFKTEEEARSHSRAVTDIAMANAPLYKRRIQKMMLNSHYGFLPGSVSQKMGRYRHLSRLNDERKATIWRRLFGSKTEPKPKPDYKPLPGGASLSYPSSQAFTLYSKRKAEEITKTGRQNLKDILAKMGKLDV